MKKIYLSLLAGGLLLSGCAGHTTSISKGDQPLFSVGDTSYTKNDVYSMLKTADGAYSTMAAVQQIIYDQEVPADKAMQEEADKQYKSYQESSEDFESTLKSQGYSKESYIKERILPSLQAEKLTKKYFKENKKAIQKKYKPTKAIILECDDQKTAEKALDALKNGSSQADVFKEYKSQDAGFSETETLITVKNTNVPTRLINVLYKAKKTGLQDEVFTFSSDSTAASQKAFVAILKENKFDKLSDSLMDSLSSDSDFAKECIQYYLKKHDFTLHDQSVFDYLKNNNPEYLISFPELSTDTADQ